MDRLGGLQTSECWITAPSSKFERFVTDKIKIAGDVLIIDEVSTISAKVLEQVQLQSNFFEIINIYEI